MDCKLCQEEIERYLEGSLPEGTKFKVAEHLKECAKCNGEFMFLKLADKVICEEKELESDPFLVTRVMALIENVEQKPGYYVFSRIFGKALKPALITVTLTVALLLGIVAGSLNNPVDQLIQIPDELSYMDDAFIESLEFYLNE